VTSAPAPVVPVAAARVPTLRGRRVIVGVPGHGFRGELRADDTVVHNGRTFVPVLSEQDYYRAESEQLEFFAPLIPIGRVWVEETAVTFTIPHQETALDAPRPRIPTPVTSSVDPLGRRVIQAVADGHIRDLRAASGIYLNASGVECVRVCGEPEWYRWAFDGAAPAIIEVAATELWID
jgi:hypothetical protein